MTFAQVITLVWTWVPLAVASAALLIAREKAAASVLVINLVSGIAIDYVTPLESHGRDVRLSIGYGCIDYTCGVLMVAAGAPTMAAVFGISVIAHVAYAIHVKFGAIPHSYAEQVAVYEGQLAYGWTTFALSILLAMMLVGGGGGSRRRDKHDLPVPPTRWWGLVNRLPVRAPRARKR